MKKKKRIVLLSSIALGALIVGGIYFICRRDRNVTVVSPTCLENGYTIYEKDGKTQIKNVVPAKGHKFEDWVVLREIGEVTCGLQERTCAVCGEKEEQILYPQLDIPRLCFDGDISGIDKTQQAKVRVDFLGADVQFNGYAQLKHQGHESLKYDKKNFTVKFYEDENCDQKKQFVFNDWNPENKFILKANYIDASRSRNLICADIWSQMVSTRDGVSDRLLQTSHHGAVDGFPVAVYLNGEFLGLYNLTLHKDDGLFSMEDGQKDGIAIINKGNTPEAFFKHTIDWENADDWEIEYCGTNDEAWIKEKVNQFVAFVMDSSDEDFKTRLSDYADVNSMIDYMIAAYSLGLQANFSKDLIFFTYDDGVWNASLFDMETAFGFVEAEHAFSASNEGLPLWGDGVWYSNTESLLWDRFINVFFDQIAERYQNLRKTVLSESNITAVIRQRVGAIPQAVNLADLELYPDQPMQDISHEDQMTGYAKERLALLDDIFRCTRKGESK